MKYKNIKIMTELVLKNRVSKQKLDSIIYFLGMLNIDVEIKKTMTEKKEQAKPLFAETFGMWEGRNIDVKEIRQKARERRTKSYDNAAL
jgi:hypothetical protein